MKTTTYSRGQLFSPLKELTVENIACQHGARSFDFGMDSAVCRHLVQRAFRTFEDEELRQDVHRHPPFTLRLDYRGSIFAVPLLDQELAGRLVAGEPINQLLRERRELLFKDLFRRHSQASFDELRRMLAPWELVAAKPHKDASKLSVQSIESFRVDLQALKKNLALPIDLAAPPFELPPPAVSVLRALSPAIEAEGRSPEMAKVFVSTMQGLRQRFCLPLEELAPGQLCAIALDITDRRMHLNTRYRRHLPVRLTLYNEMELASLERLTLWDRAALDELLARRIARLFTEAYCQGGLLSVQLVALLTHQTPARVTRLINHFEASHSLILPTPGTIHDAGSKFTHKGAIVRLHLAGKTCQEIAYDTFHSEEAVSRYIDDFERTLIAQAHKLPPGILPRILKISPHVLEQYQAIISQEIGDSSALERLLAQRHNSQKEALA